MCVVNNAEELRLKMTTGCSCEPRDCWGALGQGLGGLAPCPGSVLGTLRPPQAALGRQRMPKVGVTPGTGMLWEAHQENPKGLSQFQHWAPHLKP